MIKSCFFGVITLLQFTLIAPSIAFAQCSVLQLNFDLNGTVIWDDPAGGKSIKAGIESAFSKSQEFAEPWGSQNQIMTLDQFLQGSAKSVKAQAISQWIDRRSL